MRLTDKVAIVTGAGSGNGRGIAKKFSEEGANVVLVDINEEAARQTFALLKEGDHLVLKADVSSKEQVKRMVGDVIAKYGRLDILVNNAGIIGFTPFLELEEEEWDKVHDVNLKGPFLCSQAATKEMIDRGIKGNIINITSVEAMIVVSSSGHCQPHYNSSKGGLHMLTKALALELAPEGIRVNAIAPGIVETPFTEAGLSNPKLKAWLFDRLPLKRVAQPEDIANVASFLASDEAGFITGETIVADGGWMIQ